MASAVPNGTSRGTEADASDAVRILLNPPPEPKAATVCCWDAVRGNKGREHRGETKGGRGMELS